MPSDLDIEILTIDDSIPTQVRRKEKEAKPNHKKKFRTVRKSTGVGGKAPHNLIAFKPLRKSAPVKPVSSKKVVPVEPEYFDVDDDDSDDDVQVIEDDPLNSLESSTDGDNFCDICGLYLETSEE